MYRGRAGDQRGINYILCLLPLTGESAVIVAFSFACLFASLVAFSLAGIGVVAGYCAVASSLAGLGVFFRITPWA
jgi:hypothetical protein